MHFGKTEKSYQMIVMSMWMCITARNACWEGKKSYQMIVMWMCITAINVCWEGKKSYQMIVMSMWMCITARNACWEGKKSYQMIVMSMWLGITARNACWEDWEILPDDSHVYVTGYHSKKCILGRLRNLTRWQSCLCNRVSQQEMHVGKARNLTRW